MYSVALAGIEQRFFYQAITVTRTAKRLNNLTHFVFSSLAVPKKPDLNPKRFTINKPIYYWSDALDHSAPEVACKQAIPIERLPYVGEDSANIFGLRFPCGQHNEPSSLLSQFSRLKRYLIIQVATLQYLFTRPTVSQTELEALRIEPGTSGPEVSKSDHYTTEAVGRSVPVFACRENVKPFWKTRCRYTQPRFVPVIPSLIYQESSALDHAAIKDVPSSVASLVLTDSSQLSSDSQHLDIYLNFDCPNQLSTKEIPKRWVDRGRKPLTQQKLVTVNRSDVLLANLQTQVAITSGHQPALVGTPTEASKLVWSSVTFLEGGGLDSQQDERPVNYQEFTRGQTEWVEVQVYGALHQRLEGRISLPRGLGKIRDWICAGGTAAVRLESYLAPCLGRQRGNIIGERESRGLQQLMYTLEEEMSKQQHHDSKQKPTLQTAHMFCCVMKTFAEVVVALITLNWLREHFPGHRLRLGTDNTTVYNCVLTGRGLIFSDPRIACLHAKISHKLRDTPMEVF
uniref:Uncharacterized protein n=1 Tax=Timema monikensis TaxID=170555 RepID=A0A7R9HP22_9NEOP|nr:unnamed protein product [Timema monikensis]